MGILSVFNFITLNGYYKGPQEDTTWHSHGGTEEHDFALQMVRQNNLLLFGRLTYEMMASYWPGPDAASQDPLMAEGMNKAEKIVFSKSLEKPYWNNSRIISNNVVQEIKALKKNQPKNLTILGSGSIVNLCTEAQLIDEYQFLLDPVALGRGTAVFSGMTKELSLKLAGSRIFESGSILLRYHPRIP